MSVSRKRISRDKDHSRYQWIQNLFRSRVSTFQRSTNLIGGSNVPSSKKFTLEVLCFEDTTSMCLYAKYVVVEAFVGSYQRVAVFNEDVNERNLMWSSQPRSLALLSWRFNLVRPTSFSLFLKIKVNYCLSTGTGWNCIGKLSNASRY